VDASDPNSEFVTPPRPDWDHAIRYWRALHDPRVNYSPTGRVGPTNTYYLARTVVEYPFTTDDPWNRWNDNWAAILSAGGAQGVHNWAPIPRVVNSDIDYLGALRTTSLQPGYPYLDIQYQLANGWLPLEQAARPYRDLVVGMTPNAVDYDVTDLAFQPLVVSGEWLTPASGGESDDYSNAVSAPAAGRTLHGLGILCRRRGGDPAPGFRAGLGAGSVPAHLPVRLRRVGVRLPTASHRLFRSPQPHHAGVELS
jgi:hypothetical protein